MAPSPFSSPCRREGEEKGEGANERRRI